MSKTRRISLFIFSLVALAGVIWIIKELVHPSWDGPMLLPGIFLMIPVTIMILYIIIFPSKK